MPMAKTDVSKAVREAQAEHKATKEKRWTVTDYFGHPNYCCVWCARATLEKTVAYDHFRDIHWTRPAPVEPPPIPSLDLDGNVIESNPD